MSKARFTRRQRGSIMVETAMTVLMFIAIMFAIIELSVFVYHLSSMADATREGVRYLSVNEPLIELSEYECDSLPAASSCAGNSECEPLLALMQQSMQSLEAGNIYYQYNCASTGFSEGYFQIYSVDVWLEGIEYGFVTPGLALIDVEMPTFRASRLSEDLETVE